MTDYNAKLADAGFQNWLKAALAISIAKKGAENCVNGDISKFHNDILSNTLTHEQFQNKAYCVSCSTDSILPVSRRRLPNKPTCPDDICNKIRDKIFVNHIYRTPSWNYSSAEKWCESPWEIAKCYLPPKGYTYAATIESTDLNGILSIILNLLHLVNNYNAEVCEKAREVTRKIRHSADLTLPTGSLFCHLDTLIDFLGCSEAMQKDNTAIDAAKKIKQLKTEQLTLSKADITKVLEEELRDGLEEMNDSRKQCIQNVQQAVVKATTESINQIFAAENEALSNIEQARNKSVDDLEHKKEELKSDMDYHSLRTKLKEDLIMFNWTYHTTMALSPLFDKRDTPLQLFYVEPKLYTVEHPLAKTIRSDVKRKIDTMDDIFRINRCNEVYVTSKAGMGKTAFCKRLAFTWCQAHGQRKLEGQFNFTPDLAALRKFEYLFLIPLRNTLDQSEVDDMIVSQVLQHLSRSELYTKTFLQEILTCESCLVILDGLDEWTYPKEKPGKHINDIPHRRARTHCTVLTTTRTWKYCSLSLSSSQIDLHVQIVGLADEKDLIANAFKILDVDEQNTSESIDDFTSKLDERQIIKLKTIPLILVSLICLWHRKRTLGKSYCQIFFSMVELLLHRAEIKSKGECSETYDGCPTSNKTRRLHKPEILQDGTLIYCEKYYETLTSLGRLAFETFFRGEREQSLVFDSNTARSVLGDDFKFCVHAGFLTLSAMPRNQLTDTSAKMTFAHKTFQEFFAALYMYTSSAALEKIKQECCTVEGILSVSNFFVFLSGISPNKAKMLSTFLSDTIASSDTISGYRSDMGSWNYFVGYNETIKKLQTLFVDCATESINNCHRPIELRIEDFIVDEDYERDSYSSALKGLMRMNIENVKSIKIRNVKTDVEFKEIVKLLGLTVSKALEKIDLKCALDEETLEGVLQCSEPSLKCFIIKGGCWLGNQWQHDHVQLSNRSLQFIWSMKLLEELYLRNLEMTHKQFDCLLHFVSVQTNMKHIGLGFIRCKSHGDSCSGAKLELSKHSSLKMLEVGNIPIASICINTTSIEVCYIGDFKTRSVLTTVFETLQNAPKLNVFCCGFLTNLEDVKRMLSMISLLKNLQKVWLIDMNMGHHTFQQGCGFEKIEAFFMIRIQLDCHTFKSLVTRIENGKTIARVGLYDCDVTPTSEFDEEKKNIKARKTIHVIHDDPVSRKEFIFRTLLERSQVGHVGQRKEPKFRL